MTNKSEACSWLCATFIRELEEKIERENFYRSNAQGDDLWGGFLHRLETLGNLVFACHVSAF